MGPPLNRRDIKMQFLIKLLELSLDDLNSNIKFVDVFKSIVNDNDMDDKLMKTIVQELIEEDFIRRGNNEDEIKPNTVFQHKNRLALLNMLNEIVNMSNGQIGITVNINGSTVSGDLISIRQYYNGVSNLLKERDRKNYENWDILFKQIMQTLPKDQKEMEAITFMKGFQIICLQDARIYVGNKGIPMNQGGYWMGRIDSVDGFFIGKILSSA